MSIEIEVDTREIGQLAKSFIRYNLRARLAIRSTMNNYADRLRDEVIRNASSRPGPRIVSGRYVGSIRAKRQRDSESLYSIYVSSDAPQARRLEYGFIGIDSRGRNY